MYIPSLVFVVYIRCNLSIRCVWCALVYNVNEVPDVCDAANDVDNTVIDWYWAKAVSAGYGVYGVNAVCDVYVVYGVNGVYQDIMILCMRIIQLIMLTIMYDVQDVHGVCDEHVHDVCGEKDGE